MTTSVIKTLRLQLNSSVSTLTVYLFVPYLSTVLYANGDGRQNNRPCYSVGLRQRFNDTVKMTRIHARSSNVINSYYKLLLCKWKDDTRKNGKRHLKMRLLERMNCLVLTMELLLCVICCVVLVTRYRLRHLFLFM